MTDEKTRDFIRAHREEDVRRLALEPAPEGVELRVALRQIEGWQTARRKLPFWAERDGILYPPRLPLEQCSSEQTAQYKQALVRRLLDDTGAREPRVLTDLTGGFGVDFSFLAPLFERAVYMERDSELCRVAAHNFRILGLKQAEIRETDSSLSPDEWPEAACCYVDPSRRDAAGRKAVAVGDCEPDLSLLQEAVRRKAVFSLIKLSPMLDVRAALRALAHVAEVHAVSVRGECRELLLVMTRQEPEKTVCHCVNLGTEDPPFTFALTEEEEAACAFSDAPGRFLYEPNASVMKCGGFRCLGMRYGLRKLHPNTHLYTSDFFRKDFPGRAFAVEGWCGFGKKELKGLLGGLGQANLAVRNFPGTVSGLRKRLKLKEGGHAYLFAATLADGRHVLLRCRKAEAP